MPIGVPIGPSGSGKSTSMSHFGTEAATEWFSDRRSIRKLVLFAGRSAVARTNYEIVNGYDACGDGQNLNRHMP